MKLRVLLFFGFTLGIYTLLRYLKMPLVFKSDIVDSNQIGSEENCGPIWCVEGSALR